MGGAPRVARSRALALVRVIVLVICFASRSASLDVGLLFPLDESFVDRALLAWLAAAHFNERNSSLAPGIAHTPESCTVHVTV